MNGNTYLEIEQANYEQIEQDYLYSCIAGDQEVIIPDDYKSKWIDNYIENEEIK